MKRKLCELFGVAIAFLGLVLSDTRAGPVFVGVELTSPQGVPGARFAMLFAIDTRETPVFGYSLDIDAAPQTGAVGSVVVDVEATNFFDARNLITAGGLTRDPTFSQIIDTGDGGVFITTNTINNSTVLALPGVNDVLAQVYFDVSADALGVFTIELGTASAFGNAEFEYAPVTIRVVPEPVTGVLMVAGVGLLATYGKSRRGRGSKH